MVTKHVQLLAASHSCLAGGWAPEPRVEEWEPEPKLERGTEVLTSQTQAEARDWWCEQPVAGVGHRAREQEVLGAGVGTSLEPCEHGLMLLVGEAALHMRSPTQVVKLMAEPRRGLMGEQKLLDA
jgi:hypothetical protein